MPLGLLRATTSIIVAYCPYCCCSWHYYSSGTTTITTTTTALLQQLMHLPANVVQAQRAAQGKPKTLSKPLVFLLQLLQSLLQLVAFCLFALQTSIRCGRDIAAALSVIQRLDGFLIKPQQRRDARDEEQLTISTQTIHE